MEKRNKIEISISSVELTDSELKSAYILSHYQKLGIKKLMADIANQKIGLKFDVANPIAFAQEEADLAGQLVILQHQLDLSAAYEIEVEEEAKRNAQSK